MALQYRIATKQDVPKIAQILTDCATHFTNRGIVSWGPIPFPEEIVAETVERKETYVVEREDETVATFRLVWSDPTLWGVQPPVAGYLHKFAVGRRFAHQGIGPSILRWVEDQVAKNGRFFLRLDCQAHNESIITYYIEHGFKRVKIAHIILGGNVRNVQLLEKQVGTS